MQAREKSSEMSSGAQPPLLDLGQFIRITKGRKLERLYAATDAYHAADESAAFTFPWYGQGPRGGAGSRSCHYQSEFCLPQALTVRQLPKRNHLAVEMARMGVTGTIIPSLLDHAL